MEKQKRARIALEYVYKKAEATSASADCIVLWGERLGVHTTVYLNHLTGDVAREVGSEENSDIGHVFCLSTATEG